MKNNVEVIQSLRKALAKCKQNIYLHTTLHLAVGSDNIEIIKSKKCKLPIINSNAPLQLTVANDHIEIVELHMQNGAF